MNRGNRVVILLAIILLTQSFAILTTQIPIARANPGIDDPKNIHLTYQGDPSSSITVTWQTTYATSGDSILYDNVSGGGTPSSYRLSATGSSHTYPGASGYIHDVMLTGLTSDKVYYFICGGPGNYSGERLFRTAPSSIIDFKFVVGGDSRTNVVKRSEVSKAMSHFNASFVLHCADYVDDGRIQSQWDQWFGDVNANWTGDNDLTIPIIPSLGNHEFNSTNFFEQFALPDNEQWYYYDWGPSLRIIVLNSEARSAISGAQATWLETVLSSTPENVWKIVAFHRNVYYSGGDAEDLTIQQYWVPIFDKYHVDIVFQGHTHHYHRTKPMDNGAVVYSYRLGTMYVTTGGWGAPLHPNFSYPYSAYSRSDYHFTLVSVFTNGSMHLEAKDLNGQTFDSVWLHSKLKYWDFPNGMYLLTQGANITQSPLLTSDNLTVTASAPKGTASTLTLYCAAKGSPLNVTGTSSWTYNDNTKMLTATVAHSDGPASIFISWVLTPIPGGNPITDVPKRVHLTVQGDPSSTVTVTWQTVYPASGDIVLYDIVSRSGNFSLYGFSGSGSHHTYSGSSGYIHDTQIIGLTPNTMYYFVCGGPGNCSNERSFRTAPTAVSEFKFVIGGDSRNNLTARAQVSQAMRQLNPSFVLHLGDMVYDGTNQTQWDEWFTDVNDNWIGLNGLTIPVVPCLGNHEHNSSNYYEQFGLPGNEQWYYYDWGPNLRIIVLNSEALPSQISGDQKTWLENVLNSTPENTWKIVMFHRNVYRSSWLHDGATDLQANWVPIFDKYHVDIVVQGHTHHYHRTKPMNNGTPIYSYREGTMYLTSGAWGAPLYDYNPESYSAYGNKTFHFVLVSVYQNGSLHFEAKDVNGYTFDSVWLHSRLRYWDFPNGMYLISQGANITQPPLLTNDNLTVTASAPDGTTSTLTLYCATRGSPLNVTGVSSWTYNNDTHILTAAILHFGEPITIMISWVNLTKPGPGPGPQPGQRPNDETPLLVIELSLAVLLVLGIVVTFGSLIKRSDTLERPEGK